MPELVDVDALDDQPVVRHGPVDDAWVATLTERLDQLPAIVISAAGRVIDGRHRLAAARQLGHQQIAAIRLPATVNEVAEALSRNARHGKPLTLAERKAAARQLMETTDWADRRVAIAAGLADRTVANLRPPAQHTHLATRVGADGKRYPVSREALRQRREHARQLLVAHPERSDRAIARDADLSKTVIGRLRRQQQTEQCAGPADTRETQADRIRLRPVAIARGWLRGWLRRLIARLGLAQPAGDAPGATTRQRSES